MLFDSDSIQPIDPKSGAQDSFGLALEEELAQLKDQQHETRTRATFLGMNPEEAQDYEKRRERMLEIVRTLGLPSTL